jgi:hypothetical protein
MTLIAPAIGVFFEMPSTGNRSLIGYVSRAASYRVDQDPIKVTAECQQFLVRSHNNSIVGSVLKINRNRLVFNSTHLSVVEHRDKGTMECITPNGVGCLLFYKDDKSNLLIVPLNPLITDLVVEES